MNPNAPVFTLNPSAGEFRPSFVQTASQPVAESGSNAEENQSGALESWEEQDEEIDENDPLWQITLKLASGDRCKAMQMLEDPDALMQYPEVRAVMQGTTGQTAADIATMQEDAKESTGVVTAERAEQPGEMEEMPDETVTKSPEQSVAKVAWATAEETTNAKPAPPTADENAEADGCVETSEEVDTEEDSREHLNLVFIGHVDAGKSTLSGNILYLTDYVDKRTIEKYEREAKSRNRESWFLAFIMDTNEEERAKGKTVEVGRAQFATQAKRYTILDAPGHKNYVPHMISGAAQADVGILVISARRGEFETGFERGGQTREHAMLAKTLGVRFLVVVVNKMDDPTVKWSRDRYEECVSKLKPFLKSCGYTIKKEVKFLAISGLTGANVKKEVESSVCDWWRPLWQKSGHNTAEPTLLDCLDNLVVSGRSPEAPLRVPVLDRYHDRGTIAMGKIEVGRLVRGSEILVMPTNVKTRVEAVYLDETKPAKSAKPGENVCVKLGGLGVEDLNKGFVLCSPLAPCHAVTSFTAQIALVELLEHRPVFTAGYNCMLHAHTLDTECAVVDLLCHLNDVSNSSAGNAKANRKLHFAKQGARIIARLSLPQSVCLEVFEDVEQLGRFTLRDEGKTIAIGKVLSLDGATNFGQNAGAVSAH